MWRGLLLEVAVVVAVVVAEEGEIAGGGLMAAGIVPDTLVVVGIRGT